MRLDLLGNSYGGATRIFKNGVDMQLGVTAGNPQVWKGKPLFQVCNEVRCALSTAYPLREVDAQGQSHLFASAGVDFWAAQLKGYRDSKGVNEPSWAVVAVDDMSARAAVVVDGGLCIWDGTVLESIEPTGADIWEAGDIHFSGGILGWRKNGVLCIHGRTRPVQLPDAGGVRFNGEYVLLWQNERGLVVHKWDSPLGLVISNDFNYNPDIRVLSDENIIVVAGINQGDEGEHRYNINWTAGTVNGVATPLVDLSVRPAPPVEPIVKIGRFLHLGWFEYGTPVPPVPSNCALAIGGTAAYVTAPGGTKIAKYLQAGSDSDLTALNALIASTRAAEPQMPLLAYWTAAAQAGSVPATPDVAVEGFCHANESLGAFEARLRAAVGRCERPWILAQSHSSNSSLTPFLAALVPIYARVAQSVPKVQGILVFSAGPGRKTGWEDHPEIHALWAELAAGITAPVIVPAGGMPKSKRLTKMTINVYASVNRKFIGCEPTAVRSRSGDDQFPVYANRPAAGGWEAITLTQESPLTFSALLTSAQRQLCLTPDGQLQSRPKGAIGGWETFYATEQPDGTLLMYRKEQSGTVPLVLDLKLRD